MTEKSWIILSLLVANTIWFGFFFYVILYHNWTPWSLLAPILCHWRYSDFEREKKELE